MTTELTATQISDLHSDLATNATMFSEADLNRLYARVQEDHSGSTERQQLVRLRLYVLRQVLAQAAKLYDYQIAQGVEKRSQVVDHLRNVVMPLWESYLEDQQQIRVSGHRAIPPRRRDLPGA